MTPQEIIEGSKLIALFEGNINGKAKIVKGSGVGKGQTYVEFRDAKGNYLRQDNISAMRYHTDYNQLLPVLDKIEKLEYKWGEGKSGKLVDEISVKYDSTRDGYYVDILPVFKNTFKHIYLSPTTNDMRLSIFEAIVIFIKQYNKLYNII